ncbi:MAG: thioredoxin family protein [Ignavibacteria bacterium]|nr:thioredoxin family protein [Ignavibacteriota bacterium]
MAAHSNTENLNTPLIDFSLKGTDGRSYSPADFKDKDILIIIFMCNHCPYVKAVTHRFVEFQKKFEDRNVRLIGINSNDAETYPEDSFENMKLYADEYEMNFPYLYDETQETARKYGAVCTPDIYVYDKDRVLRYRGRLDDNWKDESSIKAKDLEKATELLLEGKEIDFDQIPSMGCSIKWKS